MIDAFVDLSALETASINEDWNPDDLEKLALLKNDLWRARNLKHNPRINLLYVNRVCGIEFTLRQLYYTGPDAVRVSQLIGTELVKESFDALSACMESFVFGSAHKIFNEIYEHVHCGGNIYDLESNLLNSIGGITETLLRCSKKSYSNEIEYAAYSSIQNLFFCMDGSDISDIDKDTWCCASDAFHNFQHSMIFTDPRIKLGYEIAELAWDAEREWQNGTNLNFSFCSDEIESVVENIEVTVYREQEELINECASMVFENCLTNGDE